MELVIGCSSCRWCYNTTLCQFFGTLYNSEVGYKTPDHGRGRVDVVCALYDTMTGSDAELLRMYRNYNKVGVGKLTKTN